MKGYVMNASNIWTHAMKRAIGPGNKVPLEELYEQYGIKHGLQEGPEFVEWLRNIKLRNNKKWKIILEDVDSEDQVEVSKEEKTKPVKKADNVTPPVATKMTIEDVVNMSVRQARESLPRVTDLNLLKYALQEANQLAGKDSLCKIIRKRIRDLQIAR